jgi:hypothetical protein
MQNRPTLVALETELGPISIQKEKVPRTETLPCLWEVAALEQEVFHKK